MFGALVPIEWPFYPSVVAGLALLAAAYLGAATIWRPRFPGSRPVGAARVAAFLGGIATILLALNSPIDSLGDEYLFSAHMIQHLLLALPAPPLLLLGTPGWMLRPALVRWPALRRLGRALTAPLVAYALFNVVFAGYHIPAIYDAALASEPLHIVMHIALLVTGVITWWPILSPLPDELPPLPTGLQMAYLFAQTLPSLAIGALQTFADRVLYARYATAPRVWGWLDPLTDQQIGAVLMWVGGGTFLLCAFVFVFLRWSAANEARERRYRAASRA